MSRAAQLYAAGKFAEAEQACLALLKTQPNDAALHNLLGDSIQAQGRFKDSISAYGRAIQIDPRCLPAWYSAGCALNSLTEYAGALPCFEKALAIAPDHVEALHNLGKAEYQVGLVDQAMAHFRAALALRENEHSSTALATTIPGSPAASHAEVLDARRAWAEKYLPAAQPPAPRQSKGGPLRVGYISSFFQSPNWMKPVWALINEHDRARFHVSLFSDAPVADCAGYTPREGDEFVDITALSNADAEARIRQANLDILVDLNSYSRVERLPVIAAKPAPIVVAWFNLYATSGIAAYDYLIGDGHVIRPEEEPFYCEKIARVSGSYLTFDVQYPVPDIAPAPGAKNGFLTFGCFASLYKLTPQVIAAWAEILRRAPSSRLLLKNGLLQRPSNLEHVKDAFQAHGIDLARIEFSGRSPHFEYLAAYSQVDVALDPFPYNGGTTTTEAIWQGVPVVCFDGDRWAARQGVSLMKCAGLVEFVAPDVAGYVERAVELAGNFEHLAALREGMRARLKAAKVCDKAGFAREMEALYLQFQAARR